MHWKHKAAIQRILSRLPGGSSVNQLLQTASRRSFGIDESSFLFRARLALSHLDASLPHLDRPASGLTVYEFGAGSDLVGPLALRARGIPSQIVVDQQVLLRPGLVVDTLRKFRKHETLLGLLPLPEIQVASVKPLIRDLREAFGIDYRAPLDARSTGLPSRSVDLMTSNSTLEHVPAGDISPLLAECRRVLRDDGVMCFRIDYEDHYAIWDRGLSPYNFLTYSQSEWDRYNSSLQFQNRLRHRDYERLFAEAGFVPLSVETMQPSASALAELGQMELAEEFRAYTIAELGVRKGMFLLRKADR